MRRAVLTAFLCFLLIPALVVAQSSDDAEGDEVLIRINGSDSVAPDESIEYAVVVRGDLDVSGAVTEAAVVVEGELTVLNGANVAGNVIAFDGTIILRDGSTTSGDIYLSNDATWILEDGATFTGAVRQGDLSPDIDDDIAWRIALAALAGWLGATLIAIAAALVFSGIGGRQLWTSAANLTGRPGATLLTTLAFWLGLSLLVIPAVLSVVAIPALPAIAMIGLAVWYLGYIAFGTRLGASITGQRMTDMSVAHPYLASIAGTVVLQLVLLLAIGCGLVAGLIAWFGDGRDGLAVIFGVPGAILYALLIVVGLVGGGALVLRALSAWSTRI